MYALSIFNWIRLTSLAFFSFLLYFPFAFSLSLSHWFASFYSRASSRVFYASLSLSLLSITVLSSPPLVSLLFVLRVYIVFDSSLIWASRLKPRSIWLATYCIVSCHFLTLSFSSLSPSPYIPRPKSRFLSFHFAAFHILRFAVPLHRPFPFPVARFTRRSLGGVTPGGGSPGRETFGSCARRL